MRAHQFELPETPPLALVHRRVDPFLLGGVGIVVWVLVSRLPFADRPVVTSVNGLVSAAMLVISATHFGSSYHLAYADGREAVRRNPFALAILPLLLLLISGAAVAASSVSPVTARWMVRVLIGIVFTMTGWHYIKQAFGVVMLMMKTHGFSVEHREIAVLRYGLYPLWFVNLARTWGVGNATGRVGYRVGLELFGPWVATLCQAATAAAVFAVTLVFIRIVRREGRRPPLALFVPYVLGLLWFLWPPSTVAAIEMATCNHALQYLPCVHRAEVSLARERGEPQPVYAWLCAFSAAMAGGLLLARWLPTMADRVFSQSALPGLVAAVFFVSLNLHHYAMDAVIWRSSGGHVRRILDPTLRMPVSGRRSTGLIWV